jgi:hypothetical protein
MNRMSITLERANVYPMCTKMRVWFTNRDQDSHLQTCLTAPRATSFGDDRSHFDPWSLRFCKCSEWTEGGTHGPPAPYPMYWIWLLPAGSDLRYVKDFRGRRDGKHIPIFTCVWGQWLKTRPSISHAFETLHKKRQAVLHPQNQWITLWTDHWHNLLFDGLSDTYTVMLKK